MLKTLVIILTLLSIQLLYAKQQCSQAEQKNMQLPKGVGDSVKVLWEQLQQSIELKRNAACAVIKRFRKLEKDIIDDKISIKFPNQDKKVQRLQKIAEERNSEVKALTTSIVKTHFF